MKSVRFLLRLSIHAGNIDRHTRLDEFEFPPVRFIDFEGSCP